MEVDGREFKKESLFQTYVITQLKKLKAEGWKLKWFKAHEKLQSGISDLIICCYGRFVAVELKLTYNEPTVLQQVFIDDVNDADGVAIIGRSWSGIYATLSAVKEEVLCASTAKDLQTREKA